MTAPSSKSDATTSDPVYQKNPHPAQAYRITMTIEDAPGPFEWISGTAFYEMINRDACTPFDRSLGMSTKQKEDAIPIHFDKTSDTTYVATIYADGMVNGDYYGKGVCNFELNGVGISLRATGKKKKPDSNLHCSKTRFIAQHPRLPTFGKSVTRKQIWMIFLTAAKAGLINLMMMRGKTLSRSP